MNPSEVAAGAARAVEQGARTIQVLGGEPTIHLPSVLELVERLPEEAHLVYKTNGCCTSLSRDLLEGLFNTWLVDYKFGSDHCARRLAAAKDYTQAVRDTLLWARHHSRLIVRHLLMPGHVECCWKPVALWIAREMPGVEVSLRGGFWPAWKSRRLPELQGPCPPGEIESAAEFARQLGLNLVPNGIENPVSMVDGGSEAELLLLPDGRLLSHHTTPELAGLLNLVLPGTSPEPPLSPRALKAL